MSSPNAEHLAMPIWASLSFSFSISNIIRIKLIHHTGLLGFPSFQRNTPPQREARGGRGLLFDFYLSSSKKTTAYNVVLIGRRNRYIFLMKFCVVLSQLCKVELCVHLIRNVFQSICLQVILVSIITYWKQCPTFFHGFKQALNMQYVQYQRLVSICASVCTVLYRL